MADIKPDSTVAISPFTCTPFALCEALAARAADLSGLRIYHPVTLYPWSEVVGSKFRLNTFYATDADREAISAGVVGYYPTAAWQHRVLPDGLNHNLDLFLVSVSPPDENGYCSYGPGVWFSPTLLREARSVIAEIRPDFIRTGGDNTVHVSQIDRLITPPREQTSRRIALRKRTALQEETSAVICAIVASELIKDRDTVQIGVGNVSSALAPFLDSKHDLGIHSELITGGMADLARKGVVTGRYKDVHRGKVVGSALALMPKSERDLLHMNPTVELYEFSYVDDIRTIIAHQNMVAVNNALLVDLTGQIASEGIGPRIWTGVGGQTAFAIGATYSPGGRSIIVLPSTHTHAGGTTSRIVSTLPAGTPVTVQRTFVDYVVTEFGIATLRGKSIDERIKELIAVAHPDFRPALKKEASRNYGTHFQGGAR